MAEKKQDVTQNADSEVKGITGISIRTYLTAFIVLIGLMVVAFVLTQTLPAGEFDRVVTDGSEVIVAGSYHGTEGDLPFWKWLLSPILILGGPNNVMLIMLLVFLFVIGGAFFALESSGVLTYLITSVAKRFEHNNRMLVFILPLIFMLLGTLIGSFEEIIPLTAIVVALALRLGWDRIQGLGMSLLAAGCGFAVGVMNPFTIGIAQSIAGLPMFSGAGFRIIAFVIVYALLMAFLLINARRSEKKAAKIASGNDVAGTISDSGKAADSAASIKSSGSADVSGKVLSSDIETLEHGRLGVAEKAIEAEAIDGLEIAETNPRMGRALKSFVIVLVVGIAAIIACSVIPIDGLSDLVFPVCALTFLLCGTIAPLISGCGWGQLGAWFWGGVKAIAPGALLVLMASSISFMLTEGKVLDTIIFYASEFLMDKPAVAAILGIYVLVLVLEFAIPSGSAKAFLLIPLIVPLVDLLGISRQLSVLAYAFGDGFSNILYPTNPALLIALSISGVSYGQWFKRTWPFFLGLLVVTSVLLIVGLAIGYQ